MKSHDLDKELLTAPETLRELVEKYKQRKLSFDKQHKTLDEEDDIFIETSIFNHLAFKIFCICDGYNFINNSSYSN